MSESICLHLHELNDLVEELLGWSPTPYPLIYMAKREVTLNIGMKFYVDEWPTCSAAVAIPSSECNFPYLQKAVFLDASNNDALTALLNRVPIDWTKDFYFCAIFQTMREICERVSKPYGTLYKDIPEATMIQKYGESIPDVEVPDGYSMGKLSIEEAPGIMDIWKFTNYFTRESVQHRVEQSILHHPNVAVRDSSGNLVAFELNSPHGTMGMLHVDPQHRRKGLGTVVIAELSKALLSKGHHRYCHVSRDNVASIKIHEKCGFVIEEGADVVWSFFKPKQQNQAVA